MSEINLGEVYYVVAKTFSEVKASGDVAVIRTLPLEIIPVTSEQVFAAAQIKANSTLSYADCFCAQLAQRESGTVVTGDPDFLQLRQAGSLRLDWLGA